MADSDTASVVNEGQQIHPEHLHGLTLEVFARDGYPLPQPFKCDTLNVVPGERWDAIVVADEPGVWAFHCHVLGHAEGQTGMFGMVTASSSPRDARTYRVTALSLRRSHLRLRRVLHVAGRDRRRLTSMRAGGGGRRT